jgi:hypothetical protein
MALLKSLETKFGIDATYWKVCIQEVDWLRKQCTVTLCGWVDEQARREMKFPLDNIRLHWSGNDFPLTTTGNNLEEIYAKAKEPILQDETLINTNPFVDAEDV